MAPSDAKTADYKTAGPPADPSARARRQSEGASAPILPDTCNLGIVLRTLVPLNAAALLAACAASSDPADAANRFVALAMIVEPVALASLLLLCPLSRAVNGWPHRWQWSIALGIPALLAALASLVVLRIAAPALGADEVLWQAGCRALLGGAAAWAFIEYFRLRARAFSPSFSEARLQALQARIRPHFLFNSLNAVLGLMRSDPRRAEATLENLADLFRVFMRDARELVPLDDEVVTCKEYLAIEQLRLGDRLNVAWQLDQMPGDALLPSLLLQPLIENAVHHGIEPNTEPGTIEIVVSRPGERVRVEIANPLAPTPPVRPGNQMALSNVRERLMLLYDMEAELKTGVDNGRFRVLLEFPYRKERRRRDVRRYFDPDR
ncbi:MAG: inner membrane protein ypdA [Pseudomonadota bacterium]|jgi:two-component system sensor histidine kinase AlgZ